MKLIYIRRHNHLQIINIIRVHYIIHISLHLNILSNLTKYLHHTTNHQNLNLSKQFQQSIVQQIKKIIFSV